MPRIRPYRSQAPAPSPRPVGMPPDIGGGGRAIARIGQGISAIGQALDLRQEQSETSKLAVEAATADAEITNKWREWQADADPSDTKLAERFIAEEVDPRLEKIGADIGTRGARATFERLTANLKGKYLVTTSADQANLAAAAAVQQFDAAANTLSSNSFDDPSGFDANLRSLDIIIDALQIPTEKKLELVSDRAKQMAQSTVLGIIRNNPDQALSELYSDRFDQYLTGEDKNSLRNSALEQKRRMDDDALRLRALESDNALKNVYDLVSKGSVSLGLVHSLKDKMDAGDYRAALAATRTNPLGDNPAAVADLQEAIDAAPVADFRRQATNALERGDITPDTYRTMTNQNRSAQETGVNSGASQARQYVTRSLAPGEFTTDYGGREMQARAISEIDRYTREHQDATPEELITKAQEIVARYRIIGAETLPVTVGRPYGHQGMPQTVTQEDLDAAGARIDADWKAGKLSEPELIVEMDRLRAWTDIFRNQEAARKARQGGK